MAHNTDNDRTVVVDRNRGGSGLGWFIVGALIVVIVGGIWLYNEGILSGGDVDVDVTPPTANETQ